MPAYTYLIIGGGLTADAAARGIRQMDSTSPIGLISKEAYPPYTRPMLSKGLWKGKPIESIWRNTADQGVELHLNTTVISLDLSQKSVTDQKGETYTYDKLLLATGGTPRAFFPDSDFYINYRSLDDYYKLRKLTEQGQHFLVIGGGFTGSEIAAALALQNKQVTMVFPEDGIGGRVFTHSLSLFLNQYYRDKGVEVLAGYMVKGIEQVGQQVKVHLFNQVQNEAKDMLVDGVVAGTGIKPNIELAQAAGLTTGNGIFVDELLRTSRPEVFAAGDVAAFFSPVLNIRMRAEHEDNALTMGMIAGKNMAGAQIAYNYMPYFYSDLFDLGYEAVGEIDASKEVVVDWKEVYHKGVIYYMAEHRVRGVLLWNVWQKLDDARRLIAEAGPFDPQDLIGKIPM